MRHGEAPKTLKLSGPLFPRAALVFNDSVESEQADGRRVWVHLDLEPAFLSRCHGCPVAEANRFQAAAEGNHVLSERATKVSGVTTGVEAAKVAVQLAFRGPNAGLVSDDQWSIHGGHCTSVSGFSLNPLQNLVHTLQTGNITKSRATGP
jgi:hypothetical protein